MRSISSLPSSAIPLVILQWTDTWIDIGSWLSSGFFGFEVAGVTIEPASLITAIAILLFGLAATNLITRWLDRRILSRSQLDKGVRDSVKKGIGYAGIFLAGVLALTSAGVGFSNIALIAGALGVGIGFGLQSIVNNFVSGLILLAERPVKVGDWIVVGAGEGFVKQINVRSTEIETFDNCTIIVPNSSLIAEPVKNWTHRDTVGKMTIAGVGGPRYGAGGGSRHPPGLRQRAQERDAPSRARGAAEQVR